MKHVIINSNDQLGNNQVYVSFDDLDFMAYEGLDVRVFDEQTSASCVATIAHIDNQRKLVFLDVPWELLTVPDEDEAILKRDSLWVNHCQIGHDGCYELRVSGYIYHFIPSEFNEMNTQMLDALDKI